MRPNCAFSSAAFKTVVHAASSPYGNTRAVDVDGSWRLIEAARQAGVAHLVYIKIVGNDRLQSNLAPQDPANSKSIASAFATTG